MTLETLRITRGILFRCLLIGALLSAVLQVITFGMMDTWNALAANVYHLDKNVVMASAINLFVLIKFFLLFVVLVPALAIHWTLKREQARRG
jgi:magnesium-transporting ATPase (P-type)